jgi:hypothetical protein
MPGGPGRARKRHVTLSRGCCVESVPVGPCFRLSRLKFVPPVAPVSGKVIRGNASVTLDHLASSHHAVKRAPLWCGEWVIVRVHRSGLSWSRHGQNRSEPTCFAATTHGGENRKAPREVVALPGGFWTAKMVSHERRNWIVPARHPPRWKISFPNSRPMSTLAE